METRSLWFVLAAALLPLAADDEKKASAPAKSDADAERRFWLETMVVEHGFSDEEAAAALGVPAAELPALLARFGIRRDAKPAAGVKPETLKVRPYPGSRHPRIGFLDGAVDPHRDTKASIFLPWEKGGYVVVDLPEALWTQHGLHYLAHTHIPTVWDKKGIKLERQDWKRGSDGRLEARRVMPDGFEFGARVLPQKDAVDLELSLKNGTREKLTGLRAQICVLLKGAPDFDAQTNDNKKILDAVIATRSKDGKRWIVTVWDRAKPWANPPCPCMHSDPTFPDLAPGEVSTLRGRVFFHEGEDIEAEIERRKKAGTLNWAAGAE
jgi:hypothetical protein